MARSTGRGNNRFDSRTSRSKPTNRRANNLNSRSARASSRSTLFGDNSLNENSTRLRSGFSQRANQRNRRGTSLGRDESTANPRGRSFQARSSRSNNNNFRDFTENREERRNLRTRERRNNRPEGDFKRGSRRDFERNEFAASQAGDIFDKYLNNKRENPLEGFKDLAGSKFKDVFASSRNNFENPFEVKEEQKTDIFGAENLSNNPFNSFNNQAQQDSNNQEFKNPFQEFVQAQNQQNTNPNARFNQNQSQSQNQAQESLQEQEVNDYEFFNPFERVKPSPLGEEQSPKDLFSFSRGNAKTQTNQAQGLGNNTENQAGQEQAQQPRDGFANINQEPIIGQPASSQTNDEEYDEVFEYSEVVDSKTDPNVEDNTLNEEQEHKEHEFFDHANIAEEANESTLRASNDDDIEDNFEKQAKVSKEQEEGLEEDFSDFEEGPKSSRLTTIGTALFSVLSVLFVFYMLFFNQVKDNNVAPELNEARPVKIFDVKEVLVAKDAISARVFPAQVIAFKDIDVSFKLAGKIKKINVKEGDYVKKGQVIATLDDVDYKYNLERIEPNLKKVEADYNRAKELFREQVASKAYLEEVENNYLTVKKSYEYAKTQLSETVLKSPYSGTILNKYAEEQEYVNPGALVVSISSSDKIEIEAFFTEKVMQSVVKSKSKNYDIKASFSASDNKFYKVELSEFSSVIDPITQSYRVKYNMTRPKDINIFAGMISYLHVEPKKQASSKNSKNSQVEIFVPLSAITNLNNKDFVWVVGSNNTVSRRYVELGKTSANNVLIKSGLKDGDRIVQAGVHFIKDGQKINILAD